MSSLEAAPVREERAAGHRLRRCAGVPGRAARPVQPAPAASCCRRARSAARRAASSRRRRRSARATGASSQPRPDYEDRRVEITGPTDRKLVINALNSGAKGFMADFEDANSPTWANQVEGHVNLIDAIEGTITYDSSEGKHYELDDEVATLLVRPRGWHLPEKHLKVDGETLAGAFMDFGLYVFHNAQRLLDKGKAPYFYLPKMEHHLEARLWNDVFVWAQDALGIPQGSIRATVLIETLPGRVPDGRDPLRAARPLLRPQRRPLGLHLLDDQVLPRPAGVRAPRPHGREDDGAVHARLHGAARPDLPQARRVRDGRHGGADPLAQGQGGQRGGARRREGRQGARGQGRLRRHLGRAPGRRLDREGRLRRGARRQAQPDRQAAPRRQRHARAAARRRVHPGRDHRGGPARRRLGRLPVHLVLARRPRRRRASTT